MLVQSFFPVSALPWGAEASDAGEGDGGAVWPLAAAVVRTTAARIIDIFIEAPNEAG